MSDTETPATDSDRGLDRLERQLLLHAPLFDDPSAYAAGVSDTIDALRAASRPSRRRPVDRTRVIRIPPSPDEEQARSGGRARSAEGGEGPPR